MFTSKELWTTLGAKLPTGQISKIPIPSRKETDTGACLVMLASMQTQLCQRTCSASRRELMEMQMPFHWHHMG